MYVFFVKKDFKKLNMIIFSSFFSVFNFIWGLKDFSFNFSSIPHFFNVSSFYLIKGSSLKSLGSWYQKHGYFSLAGSPLQQSSRNLKTKLRAKRSKRGGSGPSLPSLDLDSLDARKFAENPLTPNNFIILRQRLEVTRPDHNPFAALNAPISVVDWLRGNIFFNYLFNRETPEVDYYNSDPLKFNKQLGELRFFWQEVLCRATSISPDSLLETKVANLKVSNGLKCPNDRFLSYNLEIQREVAQSRGVYTSSEVFIKPTIVTLDRLMSDSLTGLLRAESTLLTVLASKNAEGQLKFPYLFNLVHGHPETPLNAGKGVKWLATTLEANEIRLLTIIQTEIKSKDGMDELLQQQLKLQKQKADGPSSTYFEVKIRPQPDSGKILSFGQGMARTLDLYPTFNQARGYYDLYAELTLSKDTAAKFFKKCCLDPNRKDSFVALQYQTAYNYIEFIPQFQKLKANVNTVPNLGDAKYAYNAPTIAPLEKDTAIVFNQVQAYLTSLQSENPSSRKAALDFFEVLIHTVWFPELKKPENKHRLAHFATQFEDLAQSDDIAFLEEKQVRLASFDENREAFKLALQDQIALLQSVEALSQIWLNQVRDNAPQLFTDLVAWYKSNFNTWKGVTSGESWKQGRQQRFKLLIDLLKQLKFIRQLPPSGSLNVDGRTIILNSTKLQELQQWEIKVKEKLLPDFEKLYNQLLNSQNIDGQSIDTWVVAYPGMSLRPEVKALFEALAELDASFVFYLSGLQGSLAEVADFLEKEKKAIGLEVKIDDLKRSSPELGDSNFGETNKTESTGIKTEAEELKTEPIQNFMAGLKTNSEGEAKSLAETDSQAQSQPKVELGKSEPGESVLGESVLGESVLGESELGESELGELELGESELGADLTHLTLASLGEDNGSQIPSPPIKNETFFFGPANLKFPTLKNKNTNKRFQTNIKVSMANFDGASSTITNRFIRTITNFYCQAVLDSYFGGKASPRYLGQRLLGQNYAVTSTSVSEELEMRLNNETLLVNDNFYLELSDKTIVFETLRLACVDFSTKLKKYTKGTPEYYSAAAKTPIKFYSLNELKALVNPSNNTN